MSSKVHIAFERRIVMLPASSLLPRKTIKDTLKKTVKYRRIAKSVEEVGIIEPLAWLSHSV